MAAIEAALRALIGRIFPLEKQVELDREEVRQFQSERKAGWCSLHPGRTRVDPACFHPG